MEPIEIAVTILSALVPIIVIILQYYFRKKENEYKEAIQRLENEKNEIQTEFEKLKSQLEEEIPEKFKKIYDITNKLKNKMFHELYLRTLHFLGEGIIKLTGIDYFKFWSGLHTSRDIIFFRVTSRIDPKVWREPEVSAYQKRQIENIKIFKNKPKEEREKAKKIVENLLGEKITDHFERIFIIDDKQKEEKKVVDTLAEIINEQKKHMSIRIICIPSKERPMPGRPHDFGILVTEDGSTAVMDLDLSDDWEPLGGKVIFNDDVFKEYWGYYKTILKRSQKI